jgi:hypothetical protein
MCWRRGQSVGMPPSVAEGEQWWAKGRRRRVVIVSATVAQTVFTRVRGVVG